MTTVAQILNRKPTQFVATVAPEVTVAEAARQMAERGVGALLVTSQDQIVGIVSERDFARKVLPSERSPKDVTIRDVMTTAVMYVESAQTIEECMSLMTEHRLRHLPVLDGGRLAGMVSIGDVVMNLISEQQLTIQNLEHYINGTPTLTSHPLRQ
jgi:CBS domain-containing protein